MNRYDVTVRSVSADQFFIRLDGKVHKADIRIDTLTSNKKLIYISPKANAMVLNAGKTDVSKTSFIDISHELRMRDRIAVDGKETLNVGVINRMGLDSENISLSAGVYTGGKNGMSIDSSVAIYTVSPTTLGDLDYASDMAYLDEMVLEDIDHTEV